MKATLLNASSVSNEKRQVMRGNISLSLLSMTVFILDLLRHIQVSAQVLQSVL